MSDKTLPRPPQTTLCGGAVLIGSVAILMLSFGRVSTLGSIEAQESAQAFVDTLPQGVGLTADGWQTVIRVLSLISGGLSVVTGYLGWQVLQRDRRARLALSVLAPVMFIAGTAVAEIIPAVMAVAVVLLWRQPSRDWFDGKAAAARPTPPVKTPAAVSAPSTATGSTPEHPSAPVYPPPQGAGFPSYAPPASGPRPRPGAVTNAAVATIVASAIVLVVLAIGLLFVLGDRAEFERTVSDELASQPAYADMNVTASALTGVAIGALVVFLLWSIAAIVLAVLTLRGSNGARITLVVSAITAALTSLIGVLAIFPILVTGACVTVAVLLLRGEASAWFDARKRS